MRLIGSIDDKQHLEKFVAYLITQHISIVVEPDHSSWQLWVRDEDQVDRALRLLDEFKNNPQDAKYSTAIDKATGILQEKVRQRTAAAKRIHTADDIRRAPRFRAPLTMTLLVMSAIVWLLTNLGSFDSPYLRTLLFTSIDARTEQQLIQEGNRDSVSMKSYNLYRGEVWRLITPIFIHFGPAHLIFNMLALLALGRPVEHRYGTFYYGCLVLVLAIASNYLQAVVPERLGGIALPDRLIDGWLVMPFGGMSGVIYGLFSFAWMKSEYDPTFGFVVPLSMVIWAIGWFYLGVSTLDTKLLGTSMANWAHGVGLVGGILIGLATLRTRSGSSSQQNEKGRA